MRRPRRRVAAWTIALGVVAGHFWLVAGLQQQLHAAAQRGGAELRSAQRLQVKFVRVLQPREPPAAVTLTRPAPPLPRAPWLALPVLQIEAPQAAASAPAAAPAAASAGEPAADGALARAPQAGAGPEPMPAAAAASAPTPAEGPAFDWPPSTRLRYALSGNYRGEIAGHAQVEWLRQGDRYQVFLDVVIGPPFAPLISRQMRSEGRLAADGLHPLQFEERTRMLWREPRVFRIDFEPAAVRLPGNRRVWRPAGVQDAVSQFVQLTWRFSTEPSLLQAGHVLVMPLALPSHVGAWIYDVRQAEMLATPAGPVRAVHVQPRRQARPGGDLVAEMWFAPALQYLPVRILIRQDDDTFVDLLVDRLPEQAASIEPDPPEGDPKR